MIESSQLVTSFMLGLLGSVHCLSMCGGIACLFSCKLNPMDMKARFTRTLSFNLGRIGSYSMIGALMAGLLTQVSQLSESQAPFMFFRVLACVLVILFALRLLGLNHWLGAIERLGSPLWRVLSPITKKGLAKNDIKSSVLLGLLWGLLPCGLVYAALSYSAQQSHAASGALLMLFFGLGTLLPMLALGLSSEHIIYRLKSPIYSKISALILLSLATLQLVKLF